MKAAAPLLVLALLGCTAAASTDNLTDDALAAQAAKIIRDRDLPMEAQTVLSTHHGTKVVVTSRCSDVCPVYTIRVVHYDLAVGPACDAVGGRKATVMMPFSIAVRPEDFCVPAVLFDRELFTGHPYRDAH